MIGANDREFGFFAPPADRADAMFAPFGADKDEGAARPTIPQGTGPERSRGAADERPGDGRAGAAAGAPDARRVQPTYAYRFSYVASSLRAKEKGALHATEIPFVFATVQAKYEAATTPEDVAMGEAVNAYWVAFAKTGDPNGDGRPSGRRTRADDRSDHGLHDRRSEARAGSPPRAPRLRRSPGLDAAEAVARVPAVPGAGRRRRGGRGVMLRAC